MVAALHYCSKTEGRTLNTALANPSSVLFSHRTLKHRAVVPFSLFCCRYEAVDKIIKHRSRHCPLTNQHVDVNKAKNVNTAHTIHIEDKINAIAVNDVDEEM